MILLLAGERSGDLHGAGVARGLRDRFPDCRMLGMGGSAMAREGVRLLAELDDLAVMGFVEVLWRLPYFWRLERTVRKVMREEGVDLVIPIDYPGFNLRMTEHAHEIGVPVLYYIAPQVWAWKAGRTARLARAADRIAVILPFEEEIFRKEGGRAVFVGHPLLDREAGLPDRKRFADSYGLDPSRPILALFPGSRRQELARHLDPFLGAAARLRRDRPELQIALARAPELDVEIPGRDELIVVDDGEALLHHARAAIVKSGTSTLQAALEGTPFVTAYRTHPLTFRIAQRLVRVDHVALANLVAGDRVVPELLQSEVTPAKLADAVAPLLEDGPQRDRVKEGLGRIRAALGSPGAAGRVVDLAQEILQERGRDRGP